MNLRRIIREEMENPLAWISDVPQPFQIETTPFKGEPKKYWITKGEKIKTGDLVVYQTASGLWREYGIMNPEKVDNANEANSEYYKVLKVMNESDDLEWINDVKPALNQDQEWVLVNDVNPSSIEESIKIQKYLFNLGYKWFSSELIKDTIYTLTHFPSKGLRGDLTYYSNKENERELANREIERRDNVYYWSQIKSNKINESEDPLQWIKDIGNERMEPRVGDRVRVINNGSEESYEAWLGMFSNNYTNGDYGDVIEGRVIEAQISDEYGDVTFLIEEEREDDQIFFPHYVSMENEGLDLYYELNIIP